MSGLFQFLINFSQVHYYLAYILLFVGSLLEATLFFGFFIRGEIIFIVGGILAGTGDLNIWIVIAVCIIGGLLGDSLNYFLGRKYGHVIAMKLFKKDNRFFSLKFYWKSRKFFKNHGNKTVFLGRFGVAGCFVVNFLAGVLHMPYKTFLKYDIPAAILGICEFILIGYLFGFSYEIFLPKVERYLHYLLIIIFAVILYFVFRKSKLLKKLDFEVFRELFRRG